MSLGFFYAYNSVFDLGRFFDKLIAFNLMGLKVYAFEIVSPLNCLFFKWIFIEKQGNLKTFSQKFKNVYF